MSIRFEPDEYNNKHIIFSEVYDLGPIEINYEGQITNAPMLIIITASKGIVYNPVIYNSVTKEKIMIDTGKFDDAITKYKLTKDISIVIGKKYYTRSGSEGSYVYTEVTNPVQEQLSTYYEQYKEGFMHQGDIIEINTETGNVSVTLIRNSERTNILNCVTDDSTWLSLNSGLNYFNYDSRSSYDDPPPEDLIDTHTNLSINIKSEIYYIGV